MTSASATNRSPRHKPSRFDRLLLLTLELQKLDNVGAEAPWEELESASAPFIRVYWGNHPRDLTSKILAELLLLPAVTGIEHYWHEPETGCARGELELRSLDDADLLSVVEVFERHITLHHRQFTHEFISEFLAMAGLTRLPRG